jgi:hypothetical protein
MTAEHDEGVARPDALGRIASLECVTELPVLGIDTRFESNDPRLIRLVEQTFGVWRASAALAVGGGESATLRFVVEPGEEGPAHARLRYRVASGGRVILTTTGSVGVVDPARRESLAWVTSGLLEDAQHFRYGVLEALTIALLSRLDRQPVHAAAIAAHGVALLLAGPTGAGKSTLAYAAARAGLDVLAEDVVYVQLNPSLRVWGGSSFLHLPIEALQHFPELDAHTTVQLANGKEKLVVDLRHTAAGESGRAASGRLRSDAEPQGPRTGRLADPPVVERAGVCLVRRVGGGEPSLTELDAATVARTLGQNLEGGFDLFADTLPLAHAAIAAGGGWQLDVAGPPAQHVPLLRHMLERLRTG